MTYLSSIRSGAASDRRAARHKLFEPVTVHVAGDDRRAHLLDISTSGALAHAEAPPRPGDRLLIGEIGLMSGARVIWVRGKRFGMHFDMPLPQTVLDLLLGV